MKKIIVCIFALFVTLGTWGCTLSTEKASENLPTYTATLNYNEIDQTLSGNMNVEYQNQSETTLESLKFNLYPNAFREGSSQPVISLSKSEECYYNGPSFGDIQILSAGTNQFEVCGQDQNILSVTLPSPLKPASKTTVTIDFVITLPNISHRFGVGQNTINFGNFLPTLCVLENGTWTEITYHSNGDPFYSACANYEITFSYPGKFTLASSGVQNETNVDNDIKITTITAPAIRDFAMVLCDKFTISSQTVGNTTVNYYHHSDPNFEQSLATACKAVKTFNSLYGTYPYPQLSVVEASFCIGGMEFPNIVLIGDTIANADAYQTVIVHEIAHQWWYGVVGSNQTNHAWIDEGLAEFSTAMFYKKNQGYALTYDKYVATAQTAAQIYSQTHKKVFDSVDTSMDKPLSKFESENQYIITTYNQGLLMFDALSGLISEKVVLKCLKNFFITFAFDIAAPEDLIASFEKTTSLSLEPFFNSWLEGNVVFGA